MILAINQSKVLNMKTSSLTLSPQTRTSLVGFVATSIWMLLCLPLPATVLDNFSGAKSGWTDTLNGGSVVQSGGFFTITTATGNGALTYSRKTSSNFANALGATLEFRVDVGAVSPPNGDTNALAVLAWVPTGGALLSSGYSLAVGAADVIIRRDSTIIFATNFTALAMSLANTNITLVLRMTPSGSAMNVNARVYRRIADGLIGQYSTAIFEVTAVDPSGLIGSNGNAALAVVNQASASGSSASFGNLQVFNLSTTVLDNFDVNNGLAGWTTFKKDAPDTVTETGGQLDCVAYITSSAGGFSGAYYTAKTFKIADGGRVEFQLDLVNNVGGNSSYPVLGYLPGGGLPALFSLTEYHLASDLTGHTIVVGGKQYGSWWAGRNDIQPPTSNARYTLTMTGEGSNCRIETRIEDLSLDINDPARVSFQSEFVDTPNQDAGLNETASSKFPYLNVDGNFAISVFSAGAQPAHAIFDNAVVTQTLPPPAAPSVGNIVPTFGANFLTAGSTSVSFDASDNLNVPLANMVLTLNGIRYTNGSPGVTITPGTTVSATRHFVLSGALAANANYAGSLTVTGPFGLSSTLAVAFDTFTATDYLVEAEEFNFSINGTVGGAFIDNPHLDAQGTSGDPLAYNGVAGLQDIDFHDNRTSGASGFDADHDFRLDNPYNTRSTDFLRAKYSTAGAQGDGGFNEEEISDIHNGDWLNYTHTYPAGTYYLFLRQSQFKFPQSLATLERVTSDPTQPNQTTAVLGSFIGSAVGTLFANTQLTDGAGNPLVLRFSGSVDTLRLNDRITPDGNADVGTMALNYLILVPVSDPGTLRPVVSLTSPVAGASVAPDPNSGGTSSSPATSASIVNRDTTLNTGTVVLKMNGNTVAATVTPTASGADVAWSLSVLPPTRVITNTLVFQDSDGINLTYSWTYTYPFISAANALPLGTFPLRGWNVRMVQTNGPTLGNDLFRAEEQLAIPPLIPFEVTTQIVMQVVNWNDAGDGTIATPFGYFPNADAVPGLPPDGTHDNIAIEILGYAKLTAGAHRFGALSDDGFQLRSGAGLRDPAATVAGVRDGGTFDGTFDFVVGATGLYPVRCVWYENGGSADFQLFSVDPDNPTGRILLNDPGDPAGVVQVYQPIGLLSASSISGPFTPPAGALIDPTTQTVTVPLSGSAQFFRMITINPVTLSNIHVVGPNVVFNYN
jgi:hypothetical protein